MRKTWRNCGVIGMNGELDEIMTKDYIPPCEHIIFSIHTNRRLAQIC